MPRAVSATLAQPAIRIAAAGLGAAVAGPLGCALGGWIGDSLGKPASDLIHAYLEKFGEEASKKLLETGADSLSEKLKRSAPDLAALYRETFRLSLAQIRMSADPAFTDWFNHWDVCLRSSVSLDLEEIHQGQLNPEKLESLFGDTLQRLDAQGEAIGEQSISVKLKTRPIPRELLGTLQAGLAAHFGENFRTLVVRPEHEQAWKETQWEFQSVTQDLLLSIDQRVGNLDQRIGNMERMLAALLEEQRAKGEIPSGVVTPENKRARIEEAARELPNVVEEIRQSPSIVATANVEQLLTAGRLDEAAKVAQTQFDAARKAYAEQRRNFAQACYDMGRINEIGFRWTTALENYRQAWALSEEKNAEYGFKYALFAARLNLHQEATAVFEATLPLCSNPGQRASTLHNLGLLYAGTQRYAEAEKACTEALAIRRKLAATSPAAYESYVADTLNNLGLVYKNTQRHAEAEEAYTEAFALYRKLAAPAAAAHESNVALALNNLALLYAGTQRQTEAETAYTEVLALRRKLAAADPAAYEPDLATTLNSLGCLYKDTQRYVAAEKAYVESLALRRKLAAANPTAYEPELAGTLHNLGSLYAGMQRHRAPLCFVKGLVR